MLAYGLPRIIRFRVSLISKQSAVSTGHFAYAACAHRSTEGARQQPPPKLRTLAVAAAAATLTAALCGTRGQEPWCDATPATCIDHVMPAVDEIFRAEKESAHIPGILYGVMQDGKLIHSVALGMADVEKSSPVDLTTRFKIASMSKSFTALAILQLRDRGVLSLDDPVARFIPLLRQLPATARAGDYPALTLRHLLTHAGGMPQEDPWADRLLDMPVDAFMQLIEDGVSLSSVPGTGFEYSNLGYALLGQVIEAATGESYQQYIKKNIWEPLGMHDTTYEMNDVPANKLALGYRWEGRRWTREEMLHDGAFGAMGGVITTLGDFSKYVAMHMSVWPAGSAGGAAVAVARTSTLREMHTPAILDAIIVEKAVTPFANCYGLGFRIAKFEDGTLFVGHAGGLPGFGCDHRFLPTHPGLAIISLSNRTYAEMPRLNLVALKRILQDLPRVPEPISDILQRRSTQLKYILTSSCVVPPPERRLSFDYRTIWMRSSNKDCFATNFFVDIPVQGRARELLKVLAEIGGYISHYSSIVATNKLRGKFIMTGVNGRQVEIAFTLSAEHEPKIQHLSMKLLPMSPGPPQPP